APLESDAAVSESGAAPQRTSSTQHDGSSVPRHAAGLVVALPSPGFGAHWAVPAVQYGAVQFVTHFGGLENIIQPAAKAAAPVQPAALEPPVMPEPVFDETVEDDPLAGTWTGKLEPFDAIADEFNAARWPAEQVDPPSDDTTAAVATQ